MSDELQFNIYRNPSPPVTLELARAIGSDAMHLLLGFEDSPHNLRLDEFICDTEAAPTDPEILRAWQQESTGWVPQRVLDWWLPKFDTEPNLVPMPLGWWFRRSRAIVAAESGKAIVAAGALTTVIGDSVQGMKAYEDREICFEIRATVVEEAYRENGLFKGLVEQLLTEARQLGRLPTFLATDNEILRRIIRRQAFTAPVVEAHANLRNVLCWCKSNWSEPCDECPVLPGRSLWWRTDLPLPTGEKDMFDYQDGPVTSHSWRV
jgi:hypothetical protein